MQFNILFVKGMDVFPLMSGNEIVTTLSSISPLGQLPFSYTAAKLGVM